MTGVKHKADYAYSIIEHLVLLTSRFSQELTVVDNYCRFCCTFLFYWIDRFRFLLCFKIVGVQTVCESRILLSAQF